MARAHPPSTIASDLPLPKTWTKSIRLALLHVVSLGRTAITHTRGWATYSRRREQKLRARLDEAEAKVALLTTELAIKDRRMLRLPPKHRPQYAPNDRLEILLLRAARGWTLAETSRRFLITAATVRDWVVRLDEEGPEALVRPAVPVNRFPDFVAEAVRHLRASSPLVLGKKRIAETLARAGLHIAASTAGRMLAKKPARPSPRFVRKETTSPIIAHRVHEVWQMDLTCVPVSGGLWTSWFPHALPQCWPFCWWVGVIIDHYSRRVVASQVFGHTPNGAEVRRVISAAMTREGASPTYLVTDRGPQFRARHVVWCEGHGIRPRFRSKSSINASAIIERFFRSLKDEYLRKIALSLRHNAFRRQLATYVEWYHEHRPHSGLGGRTPAEVYEGRRPKNRAPRFEPRAAWPKGSRCAAPQAPPRARVGAELEIEVRFADAEKRLPIVELRRAA